MILLLCSVLFTPQREKGQSRYSVLSPLGPHEDAVVRSPLPTVCTSTALSWVWPPAERTSSPPGKPGLPFPFCLCCCQGQKKTKTKQKMLLKLKLENTEGIRQIAVPVTKANPEAELGFLSHLCKRPEKSTGASTSSVELMPEHPVVPGWLRND